MARRTRQPSSSTACCRRFSAIRAEQQADQLTQLATGGFIEEPDERGILMVNSDPAAITETYLFTDGYWFYGSDRDVLDLIVDNIPAP